MVPPGLVERVVRQAREHCAAKGYVGGPNWNPLEPHDPVAALAVARLLVGSGRWDHYVAVAPEGHAYGFFFERLGVPVGEVFVDYPPRAVTGADGLAVVAGGRVLLIEDDVVSGVSLGLVVSALEPYRPAAVGVYLGRRADGQFPENVPAGMGEVILAETHLDPADRPRHEADFVRIFGGESV
ncbi:MAG: hypothetical protein K2X82_16225 [Gemmataceae bacterium]|nr:hypothetical protein [Gemmataceae bacterium]